MTSNKSIIQKSFWKKNCFEKKWIARNISKTLNRVGDHIVHIILKTFIDIINGLAVRASLEFSNSLSLVSDNFLLIWLRRLRARKYSCEWLDIFTRCLIRWVDVNIRQNTSGYALKKNVLKRNKYIAFLKLNLRLDLELFYINKMEEISVWGLCYISI